MPKHQDPSAPGCARDPQEIEAAALQFVRKISGYRVPSRANSAAFEEAVAAVAGASQRLLEQVATVSEMAPPAPVGAIARPRRQVRAASRTS